MTSCFSCAVATVLCGIVVLCSCVSHARPYQPNVPQGGRTVSLAARPYNAQRIFAASESGGLFVTANGGGNWTQPDSLPNAGITGVAIAPGNPDTILATAAADFKPSYGGIWRSTDSGRSWSQPAGAIPTPSALSVSFEPGSNNVYVGTDSGMSISHDLGTTWAHTVLDPTAFISPDKTQNRV